MFEQAETLQKEPSPYITNVPVAYQRVQAKTGGVLHRALLDSGSGQSYVCREHARKLDIKPCREELRLVGTVDGVMNVQCPVYDLKVQAIGEWSQMKFKTVCKAKYQCLISCTKRTPRDSKGNL